MLILFQKLSKKGKSAHDVLDDAKLSKQAAVNREELSTYRKEDEEEETEEEREARLKRIREKLKLGKRKNEEVAKEEDDVEKTLAEEKKRKVDEEKQVLISKILFPLLKKELYF